MSAGRAGPGARGVRQAERPVGTEVGGGGLPWHPPGCTGGLSPLSPPGQGGVPSGLHPPWGLRFPVGCAASPVGDGVRAAPPVGRRQGSPVDQAYIPARTIQGLCLFPKGLMLGFPLKRQDVG